MQATDDAQTVFDARVRPVIDSLADGASTRIELDRQANGHACRQLLMAMEGLITHCFQTVYPGRPAWVVLEVEAGNRCQPVIKLGMQKVEHTMV